MNTFCHDYIILLSLFLTPSENLLKILLKDLRTGIFLKFAILIAYIPHHFRHKYIEYIRCIDIKCAELLDTPLKILCFLKHLFIKLLFLLITLLNTLIYLNLTFLLIF